MIHTLQWGRFWASRDEERAFTEHVPGAGLVLNAELTLTFPHSNLMRQEQSFSHNEGEAHETCIPHPGAHWWYMVEPGFEPSIREPLCSRDASGPRDIPARMQIPLVPTWQCFCVASLGSNVAIQLTETWRNRLLQECHSWPILWENGWPRIEAMDPGGNQATWKKTAPTVHWIYTCYPWASQFLLSAQCLGISTLDLGGFGFAGWSIWWQDSGQVSPGGRGPWAPSGRV